MFLFQRSIEISCFKLVIFDFMAVCHSLEGADTANTMSMSMSMSSCREMASIEVVFIFDRVEDQEDVPTAVGRCASYDGTTTSNTIK